MKDLEAQLGILNKTHQELTSQLEKTQAHNKIESETAKLMHSQIQAPFTATQASNGIQTLTQNSISIQGCPQAQALTQNHQVIATTQLPGLNFVQNYQ